MTRRTAALGLLLAALLLPAPGASASAPPSQGWWSALHREGLPQPPAPPDVDPGELLVQGGDLRSLLPGLPAFQPRPLAVAALRFEVPAGSTVTTLALDVDGVAVARDVRAYVPAEPFEPVENGPYEKAPVIVLDDFSQGVLSADGQSLSFPDVSRLIGDDDVLAVVLIAGPGDRAVLKAPGPEALAVTAPRSAAAPPTDSPQDAVDAAPPLDPPADPFPTTGTALPPTTSSAFDPVQEAPSLPGPGPTVAGAPDSDPQVAAPAVPRALTLPVDDTRTRVLVLLQALLLGVFFGLLGYGPFAQLSRYSGLTTTPRGAPAVRGIGRFSALRNGQAPRL